MDDSDSLLIGRDDSFLASLLQADTKEAHLDAVTQSMLASLAALSPETLEDPKFLDSLSLASRLFMQVLKLIFFFFFSMLECLKMKEFNWLVRHEDT